MKTVNSIEQAILTSARDSGIIPLPQGPARIVEQGLKLMASLAERGYLEFVRKTWFPAYWLTTKGRGMVRGLQRSGRRASSSPN